MPLEREIALMARQCRHDDLTGKSQKIVVETAGQRDRPFDQGGDLVKQCVVGDRNAARFGRRGVNTRVDLVFDLGTSWTLLVLDFFALSAGSIISRRRS